MFCQSSPTMQLKNGSGTNFALGNKFETAQNLDVSTNTIYFSKCFQRKNSNVFAFSYSIIDKPIVARRHITDKPHHPEMAEKGLRLPIQGVEDPGTGMEKAGATTTERQVTPLNSVNLAVNQLAPQPAVGGKNKGEVAAVGPSLAVATAKTDIAKWRCSPLDKKLELPITTMIHPPPEKIAPDFSL